jgi:hypothetical protein
MQTTSGSIVGSHSKKPLRAAARMPFTLILITRNKFNALIL